MNISFHMWHLLGSENFPVIYTVLYESLHFLSHHYMCFLTRTRLVVCSLEDENDGVDSLPREDTKIWKHNIGEDGIMVIMCFLNMTTLSISNVPDYSGLVLWGLIIQMFYKTLFFSKFLGVILFKYSHSLAQVLCLQFKWIL